MEAHQERVVTEKNELDEKLDKLKLFIDSSSVFSTLSTEEQNRMKNQLAAMITYSSCLADRIEAF